MHVQKSVAELMKQNLLKSADIFSRLGLCYTRYNSTGITWELVKNVDSQTLFLLLRSSVLETALKDYPYIHINMWESQLWVVMKSCWKTLFLAYQCLTIAIISASDIHNEVLRKGFLSPLWICVCAILFKLTVMSYYLALLYFVSSKTFFNWVPLHYSKSICFLISITLKNFNDHFLLRLLRCF